MLASTNTYNAVCQFDYRKKCQAEKNLRRLDSIVKFDIYEILKVFFSKFYVLFLKSPHLTIRRLFALLINKTKFRFRTKNDLYFVHVLLALISYCTKFS